jgi:hypothetical protein
VKALLLYRDRDFPIDAPLPPNAEAVVQDLGLNRLLDAMADGDQLVRDIAQKVLLSSVTDPGEIRYRQNALSDCLYHPSVAAAIYDLAVGAIEGQRQVYRGYFFESPESILRRSIQSVELFLDALRRLRAVAIDGGGGFRSRAFTQFFARVLMDIDDGFFAAAETHLNELRFGHGVLLSAQLGTGNTGVAHVLRQALDKDGIVERIFGSGRPSFSFRIADRDEGGIRALSELRSRGVDLVANALAQSADHILDFFTTLRAEIGFYVGCLNLFQQLSQRGASVCFPDPTDARQPTLSAVALYDPGLVLRTAESVVPNDVAADGKRLVMITGANQGGKSTLLRSLGLAQLMMQSGMFVPAASFRANVCDRVFTHFKREEDPTMVSGKLDEELSRLSDIADRMTPSSLLLCNESFSATNEREGSEIARQVLHALIESGVKVYFVTHLYDLGRRLFNEGRESYLFLRAERQPDATRTFRLVEGGEPLPTSYGLDLYRQIFGVRVGGGPTVVAAARESVA